MRERTLQRDEYRCCSCGVKEDELDAPLHVHHIRAFVDCDSWQEANQLSNLIALCPTCHGHLEHDEDFAAIARARIAHAARTLAATDDTPAQVSRQPALMELAAK